MKTKKTLISILATILALVFALTGCGSNKNSSQSSSSNGSSNGSGNLAVWDISTGVEQNIVKSMATDFNKNNKDAQATPQFFENNAYKQKLQIAMGANKAPDIFYNWGGGVLKSYVDSGHVVDLTSYLNNDPQWKSKFLPSVMKGVTFNGKVYGIPMNKIQPVSFNYNKQIFKKYNLTPPTTYSELLNDIKVLKSHNIIPISLAGKDKWPELMYEEYLVDRIGGPQVFKDVLDNKANAWSNPAFIKANTMIQQLVKAGAFGTSYSSLGFSSGESDALVYTGKAAMQLMGAWDFSNILSSDPSYIKDGNFGFFAFPAVEGGQGDPKNIAGNPSNYYSISSNTKDKAAAVKYLKTAVMSKAVIKQYIDAGEVPPVAGIESQLKQADHSDWLTFNYDLVKNAPNFQMSWDQALSPNAAQELLDDLSKLFTNQMTPKQLSDDMNQTIGK